MQKLLRFYSLANFTGSLPRLCSPSRFTENGVQASLSARGNVEAANARQLSALYGREAVLRDVRERIFTGLNELAATRISYRNAALDRIVPTEVFNYCTRLCTTGRKNWIDVLNAIREATLSVPTIADAGSQIMGAAPRPRLLTGNLPLTGGAN